MDTQSEINQAITSASLGDQKTALSILRGLLKKDPRNIDIWLALAEIVDNPEQAKQCYDRVLQIDPDNATARTQLLGEQTPEEFFNFEPEPEIESSPEPDFSFDTPSEEIGFSFPAVEQQSFTFDEPVQEISGEAQPSAGDISPSMPIPESPWETEDQPPQKKKKRSTKKPAPKKKKKRLSVLEIGMILVIVIMCCCVGILGIAYAGGNLEIPEQGPTPTPEDIFWVIYENIRASNYEDIDRYMSTIHSRSPGYRVTKNSIEEIFSDYDLSYRVSNLRVIEQDGNKATIYFVLTTKRINGPAFRDNRVYGEMALRKEDGRWKIYNQEIENVDYLD